MGETGGKERAFFRPLDFHLTDEVADPSMADPIRIEVRFHQDESEEWDSKLVARLNQARTLQADENGRYFVGLQVICEFDSNDRTVKPNWSFVDLGGRRLPVNTQSARRVLREAVPLFYLAAIRDAGKYFAPRGRFWRPFLRTASYHLNGEPKSTIKSSAQRSGDLVTRQLRPESDSSSESKKFYQ